MVYRRKRHYPAEVDAYVQLASRAGWQRSTIEGCRNSLFRYHRWLRHRYRMDALEAGAREFIGYRKCLLARNISRTSMKSNLSDIIRFYLLKAQNGDGVQWLDLYNQLRPLCRVGGRDSTRRSFQAYSPETLKRILDAAQSYHRFKRWNTWVDCEDYEIIMTLLYTGGRAQFYGLRLDQIDFEKGEIHARMKGGAVEAIPLHPTLSALLQDHLRRRKYRSGYLFQHGRDSSDWNGCIANRKAAWTACKRVQAAAGLTESVHPHRFRKTLAVLGRQLGLDITCIQKILGHTNVRTTLDVYATPDFEDVKRAFAVIDMTPGVGDCGRSRDRRATSRRPPPAPSGYEHAWNLITVGLRRLTEQGGSQPVRADALPWAARLDLRSERTLPGGVPT